MFRLKLFGGGPPHNFCHPGGATYRRHLSCRKSEKMSSRPDWGAASLLNLFKRYFQQEYFLKEWILHTLDSPDCWYFSFSSFKTLTSLLKLWQPLQIRFDISMDENEKLYFDFFLQRQDGKACASRWCGWTWYWKIVNLVTHCVHQQTLLRQREHFEDTI